MILQPNSLKIGEFVQTWYDSGAHPHGGGMTIMLGVVRAAGPKTFTVEWPSGQRSRVAWDNPRDITPARADLVKEEREYLIRRGWLTDLGECFECGGLIRNVGGVEQCDCGPGESPIIDRSGKASNANYDLSFRCGSTVIYIDGNAFNDGTLRLSSPSLSEQCEGCGLDIIEGGACLTGYAMHGPQIECQTCGEKYDVNEVDDSRRNDD